MAEGVPKYVAVRDNLRQRIQAMQPGEKLPAEPELCDQYGVSRITLRHAIGDLIYEGLLVREQGRGTFRTDVGPADSPSGSRRRSLDDPIFGFSPRSADPGGTVKTKVLDNSIVRNGGAAAQLGLDKETELIRIERLRYVDDGVRQHSVIYVAVARFPRLHDEGFAFDSLYEYLESTYAVRLVENDVTARVRVLDGRMAWHFGVADGAPVLEIDSTVIDEFGSTIAFSTTLHAPDDSEISFIIHSQRDAGPVQS